MEMMMEKDMIFLLVLISAGLLALICFWLDGRRCRASLKQRQSEKKETEYRRRLETLERELSSGKRPAKEGRAGEDAFSQGFSGSLRQAELRVRLQQGREHRPRELERYRLVSGLAKRGLTAEDIGDILQLHVSEAEQLWKLSQVGCQASGLGQV